ncbi:hypothetical protein NP233_g3596 [Leucocoprinus birnbaumii]|uniref:F-box domain-containing protein n=1 Tax=Leucocoprinus birnbaumii TaxID=56174 RepID=A0AAD5YY77_9AGAR|nr:hypothetical protein NP233_g3596 [Leucocoprinus birnbaumii]
MPVPTIVNVKQHFKSRVASHLKSFNRPLASPPVPSPDRAIHRLHPTLDQLPFEILVEIFGYCPSDFPRIGSQEPPLTLARVCKTWYQLVMNTPRLWSCFELVLEGTGSSQPENDEMKRRLILWLHRSRQQPLSFRIIDPPGTAPDSRSAELLELLLPYAPRWQNVYFHGPGRGLLPLQGQCLGESLRSISLQLCKPWSHGFDVSRFAIPWSQLSGLDLQFYQDNVHFLDECFKILSAAKKLSWCTLNAECSFTLSPSTGKLVLPSLKSLKLIAQGIDPSGGAEMSLLGFLERLSLTSLREFSLEWLVSSTHDAPGSHWRVAHTRLADFLQSSASSLESLGLAYLPVHDHEIIRCLDELPRLRCLDLKYALTTQQLDPITDVMLQYLTPTNPLPVSQRDQRGGLSPLPGLRALKLQCSGEFLNREILLALVEGRAGQGLKEFEMLTLKSLSKEFRDRIGAWRSRGLHFSASTLNVR